jgi:hypothetical protein
MTQEGAPPKKKTSTLTIVLAIVGGGFVMMFLVAGIAIYFVLSSPKGRTIVGVMGEAVKISAKAQKAPGTKELRAMGCKQAMVMDFEDLTKIMGKLDAGPRSDQPPPFGEMVTCSVNPWGTPPACDEVATTYVNAVGPRPKPFIVVVQKAGNPKGQCTTRYAADGKAMSDVVDVEPPPME